MSFIINLPVVKGDSQTTVICALKNRKCPTSGSLSGMASDRPREGPGRAHRRAFRLFGLLRGAGHGLARVEEQGLLKNLDAALAASRLERSQRANQNLLTRPWFEATMTA